MHNDLDHHLSHSTILSELVGARKKSDFDIEVSGPRDVTTSGLETQGVAKRPSYSTSSKEIASPLSLCIAISDERHLLRKSHQVRRPKMIVPELDFHSTQCGESHTFNDHFSRLLVYISNTATFFYTSLCFTFQLNKHKDRSAKFVISVIFLMSAEGYFVPAFNSFSFCQLAGANLSSKAPSYPFQLPGYRPCWFEDSSICSRFAQVNNKLAKIADIAVLETIPMDLNLTQDKVAKLRIYVKHISKDQSAQPLLQQLSEYSSQSILTRFRLTEFARKFEVTIMRVYSTTQSTIERLRYISKIEANQAYLVWVIICILDSLFGESYYWTDPPRCSTTLCASLFMKHIDEVIPYIRMREEDASRLVQLFGVLRGHLETADEIQTRNQFQNMMQFYQAHQANKTEDIDTYTWTRIMAFLETKIWTRIKAFFEGKGSTTTALDTLAPEAYSLQLILPFIEWAEEYFNRILSNLKELEVELSQLRNRVDEEVGRTAIRCAFKKPPIRLWITQLKSSFWIQIPVKKGSEGRRKIGMSPNMKTWE